LPVKKISLRPNTPITLGFDLKNRMQDTMRDVVVKVVFVGPGNEERLIAQGFVKEIAPTPANGKGERLLFFEKIKGPPEVKEVPEKKANADKLDLGLSPFRIQLHIEAKQPKDFTVVKRKLEFIVREPRDYLSATANFEQLNKRLLVAVTYPKVEDLFGPHRFPVQLSLSPDLKAGKKGLYEDIVRGPGQPGDLRAQFEELTGEGEAYVRVDGYDRAFTFPIKLAASGAINARPREEIRVRIQVPRYAKPSPKLEVLLETDGPLQDDYRVKLEMDKTGEKVRFRDEVDMPGLRQQKAFLGVSAAKTLVCQADVTDWRPLFDTPETFGDIWIRVSVWKRNPQTKDYEKVKVTYPLGARGPLAPIEADVDSKNLFARVSFDNSKPEDLQFVNLPKEWSARRPLDVRVKMRPRTPMQAPIGKVIFFRGKAPKDDKGEIKEEDIFFMEEGPDPKKSEWSFILPPQIKVEPVLLSAQFTTLTGAKATISEPLALVAGNAGKATFIIKGKVVYGEDLQPDKIVTLVDAKAKEKATQTMTDKTGTFVFNDVAPGAYVVVSTFSFRNLEGRVPVEIKDADKTDVLIKLGPKKGK
jgi:hypothetical protein